MMESYFSELIYILINSLAVLRVERRSLKRNAQA